MPAGGHGGRTWWRWAAVAFSIGAGVAGALLLWFLRTQGLGRSDQWSSVLQLFLAFTVTAVTVWVWMIRRARPEEVSDLEALARLREDVAAGWSREVAARSLQVPLQLRWGPTARPGVQAGASGIAQARQRTGALLDSGAGLAALTVAEALTDPGVRQLVILGEPGAGKTTLAILYLVAATSTAEPSDPVPVLLSVAGWDPTAPDGLEEWIVSRVCQEYPRVSPATVRRLVRQRRVIPVLDGFDEMPEALRAGALAVLEEAAAAGLRMVLTSRGEEFARATAEAGVLPQAVVVEVAPVRVDDAVEYLRQREALGSGRWDRVADTMTADPHGTLASALSTPLMISLARQVFRRPATDPGELARADSASAVQGKLLAGFLPAVFGSSRAGERAGRWLAFLVTHLPDQPGDPNLQWWRLARAVPRLVIIGLITAAVTVLGALVGTVVAASAQDSIAGGSILRGMVIGGLLGLVFGLADGRQAVRAARAPDRLPSRRAWVSVIAGGIVDLVVAAATVSGVGAVALLVVSVVAADTAVSFSADFIDTVTGLSVGASAVYASIVVFLGVVPVVLANGLGSGRRGLPRQSRPRARGLPRQLVVGLGAGLVVGLPWTVLSLFNVPDLTLGVGLTLTAFTTGFIGVTLALGRWLSSPVTEPQDGRSPDSVLRADRRAWLVTGLGVFAVTSIVASFLLWATGVAITDVISPCLVIGAADGTLVAFGSGAAWVSYTTARVWLALRGKLPWRLAGFLRDAHERGVLRQAGAAYQIRHDLIRGLLIERWAPPRGATATVPSADRSFSAVRRWVAVAVAFIALAALPVAAGAIDPRPLPLATIAGSRVVFSADGLFAATRTDDDRARLSTSSGRPIATFGHVPFLADMYLSPGGRILVVVGDDGAGAGRTVRLWDASSGRLITDLGRSGDVLGGPGVTFSPDGRTMVTVGGDSRVRLWDTSDGRAIATLDRAPQTMSWDFLAFSPDGRTVATITGTSLPSLNPGETAVHLWDASTGRLIGGFGRAVVPFDTRFSPGGGITEIATQDNQVQLWNTFTGTRIATIGPAAVPNAAYGVSPFSPDGLVLATVNTADHRVQLWDTGTGRLRASLDDELSAARLWLGPNGRTVAAIPFDVSSGQSAAVQLWDTSSARMIATLDRVNGPFVEFSPDGRTVATIDATDYRVRLWHAGDGRSIATLDPVGLDIDMRFSPDGRTIITDSVHDGGVRLWRVP